MKYLIKDGEEVIEVFDHEHYVDNYLQDHFKKNLTVEAISDKKSKVDTRKMKPEDDKRVKLLPAQKEEIKEKKPFYSYNELAKKYKVSKTTIYYICNNDKYEENKKIERTNLRDKKKQRKANAKTRKKKKGLLENGRLGG